MRTIVGLIGAVLFTCSCQSSVHRNSDSFEGVWADTREDSIDQSQITTVLDLYLKKYKPDTLLLSYSAYSQRYISGERQLNYGKVSVDSLISQQPFVVSVRNAEHVRDTFQVSMKFIQADSVIIWKVLNHDSHEELYIVPCARLGKSRRRII